MEVLTNWKARRAGARITINATDEHGQPRKVVGVDLITVDDIGPLATCEDGKSYRLALAA